MAVSRKRPVSILLHCNSWGDVKHALAGASSDVKGDVFELLVQNYLRLSPEHGFKNVWSTHGEVPPSVRAKLGLDRGDTKGIDLVAETDVGEYVAIQAKYHQDEARALTQKECEGLVAGMTLAKGGYLRGIVCTNATEHSHHLKYDIQYLKYERWSALDDHFFKRLHFALQGSPVAPPKANPPRPHQRDAVKAAVHELVKQGRDRCRVIMACATGKTHTAFYLAEELRARKVLVAVPNLSLADQYIEKLAPEYAARGLHAKWVAVCSDKSVGRDEDVGISLALEDLRIVNVSTNADEVADWLVQYRSADRLVVLSTYQSGDVLSSAARKAGFTFDLGIFDEAHRTTGPKGSPFAHLIDEGNIAIRKRVFMTATEKTNTRGLDHVIGMNQVESYGNKVYDLSTREAVTKGIIADYRVVILACSEESTRKMIEERRLVHARRWKKPATASMLATGIGLRQVMKAYGLSHGLSFHASIKRMREFQELQKALSVDLADGLGALEVFPFSCDDSAGERRKNRESFERAARALASNVRVFVEGVDCPEIDLVAFVDPRQSKIDIVQGVGRAIRPAKDKSPKVAYIYVPVLVDERGKPSTASFRQMMTILRALKEKDDSITDDVRVMVQEAKWADAKARVEFAVSAAIKLDVKDFARRIGTRIWEGAEGVLGLDEGRLSIGDCHELAKKRGFKFLGQAAPPNGYTKTMWRCSKRHKWEATYANIKQGRGCPHCAGMAPKTIEDYRALAKKRGFVFLGEVVPRTIQTKTRWQCAKRHQWESSYGNIKFGGSGCPQCAGTAKKTIKDYHALAAKRGFVFLGKVAPASAHARAPWQCSVGHKWEAAYGNINHGTGCPHCAQVASRKSIDAYRSLAKNRGFVFVGKVAPPNVGTKVRWQCSKRHQWDATYGNVNFGTGCPHCAGLVRKTIEDYRALAKTRGFRFLSEAAPPDTDTKALWQCAKGHRWDAAYGTISRGRGCPHCAGKARKTVEDYRALAKARGFQLVSNVAPANTATKTRWQCSNGHQWDAHYQNIRNGKSCPFCQGVAKKTVEDYRVLARDRGFKFPGKAAPPNTQTKTQWECPKGHRFKMTYGHFRSGKGCVHCSGKVRKTIEDYRALAVQRGFKFVGKIAPPSVDTKTRWQCSKHHEWGAPYSNIKGGSGCPHCSGKARKTLDDYRSLAKARGIAFMGKVVPRNVDTKVPWRCSMRHQWVTTYGCISAGTGCPDCWRTRRARDSNSAPLRASRRRAARTSEREFAW